MDVNASSTGLSALPPELVQHILAYLDPLDLASVAKSSRGLREQSYEDSIWQPLVNSNILSPITNPGPLKSFRELYAAHHPNWFLSKQRIWFADTEPNGKLVICRYEPQNGCIAGYTVVATRGSINFRIWEKDPEVIIHSFDPVVKLDFTRPVLNLDVDSLKTEVKEASYPSDRGYAPPSRYSRQVLMDTHAEAGLCTTYMLCRALPEVAISENTQVWPSLRFQSASRTRNETRDNFSSAGHRPSRLSEISQSNFRIRKWAEYTGRGRDPNLTEFISPNGLTAALDYGGAWFAAGFSAIRHGGISVRMSEDITTYATLPESAYTPTAAKPWQGIWCGDYNAHGCEFLLVTQPDKEDERPLPEHLDWLQESTTAARTESGSSASSYTSAPEEFETSSSGNTQSTSNDAATDYSDAPSGRLEAIKLTGDPNIPRGEFTWLAPDIGPAGFLRIADEETFRGARVVRSAGHVAHRYFRNGRCQTSLKGVLLVTDKAITDMYTASQLIMISHDALAQYWEEYNHISYYKRVDLDSLMRYTETTTETS